MQRLTWSGIALHAGALPGRPASHGCVRMPLDFAERLFDVTKLGMRVVVMREDIAPADMSHPLLFKPASVETRSRVGRAGRRPAPTKPHPPPPVRACGTSRRRRLPSRPPQPRRAGGASSPPQPRTRKRHAPTRRCAWPRPRKSQGRTSGDRTYGNRAATSPAEAEGAPQDQRRGPRQAGRGSGRARKVRPRSSRLWRRWPSCAKQRWPPNERARPPRSRPRRPASCAGFRLRQPQDPAPLRAPGREPLFDSPLPSPTPTNHWAPTSSRRSPNQRGNRSALEARLHSIMARPAPAPAQQGPAPARRGRCGARARPTCAAPRRRWTAFPSPRKRSDRISEIVSPGSSSSFPTRTSAAKPARHRFHHRHERRAAGRHQHPPPRSGGARDRFERPVGRSPYGWVRRHSGERPGRSIT